MERWELTELESGERIVSERLDHVRSAAVGYWIAVGSRDEPESRAGISHFVEHLLFKGTPSYSTLEIAEIFDELGGELHASTSREQTLLYARVPADHVETALDVMGEMVFAPRFDDLEAERAVVLEEIAMYEDSPQDRVHDLFSEAVFGGHPLGRPIIGSADVISSLSRRAIRAWHRAAYVPGKVVVAGAVSVDHGGLVELARRAAERREGGAAGKPPARASLAAPPPPALRFQRKDTEQYHVCVGAPAVARSDPRRFAVSILDAILGGSASSRLFREIREKRGMAYSVYSFTAQYADTGQLGIYLGTREENLAEALAIAVEQVGELAAGNIPERELRRAREHVKGRIMLAMESTSARMHRIGEALASDVEILSLDRVAAELDAVDADAVAELATLLLAPERLSGAGIGPDEDRFLAALEQVTPAVAHAA